MIARTHMVSLPVDAPLAEIVRRVIESGHSRFPVHGDDPDEILGILLAKDLLKCFVDGAAPCNIRTLLRPTGADSGIEAARTSCSRNSACRATTWRSWSTNTAASAGLITIEDVLEEIVGEIDDEHDEEDPARKKLIQSQADGAFPRQRADADRGFQRAPRQRVRRRRIRHDRRHGHVRIRPPAGNRRGSRRSAVSMFRVTRADDRRVLQFAVRVHDA